MLTIMILPCNVYYRKNIRRQIKRATTWSQHEAPPTNPQARILAGLDVLRVLALAHGCELASSMDRLAVLTQRGVFTAEESEGLCEAYRYLQLLRLQHHQTQLQQGQEPNNLVRLSTLGALDARVLREALSQVRRAQRILAFRYRL